MLRPEGLPASLMDAEEGPYAAARPQPRRDGAGAGGAGLVPFLAHPLLIRIRRPIDVLDAAGLAIFCVTGASKALDHGLAAAPAVILGAITGIGGGILRDILVRQIPVVLQEGL